MLISFFINLISLCVSEIVYTRTLRFLLSLNFFDSKCPFGFLTIYILKQFEFKFTKLSSVVITVIGFIVLEKQFLFLFFKKV